MASFHYLFWRQKQWLACSFNDLGYVFYYDMAFIWEWYIKIQVNVIPCPLDFLVLNFFPQCSQGSLSQSFTFFPLFFKWTYKCQMLMAVKIILSKITNFDVTWVNWVMRQNQFCTYQLIKASAGPGEVATILKSKIVNVPFIQL